METNKYSKKEELAFMAWREISESMEIKSIRTTHSLANGSSHSTQKSDTHFLSIVSLTSRTVSRERRWNKSWHWMLRTTQRMNQFNYLAAEAAITGPISSKLSVITSFSQSTCIFIYKVFFFFVFFSFKSIFSLPSTPVPLIYRIWPVLFISRVDSFLESLLTTVYVAGGYWAVASQSEDEECE